MNAVKDSFWNSSMFVVLLVLSSTILVSLAQVAFKLSWDDSYSVLSAAAGVGLYVLGSLLFMFVLRKKKVTFVFPFMTLSYVWVLFFSAYLFGEVISLVKVLGIALIFTGVFLIYVGNKGSKTFPQIERMQ